MVVTKKVVKKREEYKYNQGDFFTKYDYVLNSKYSNDVKRFIINSAYNITIKDMEIQDAFGYWNGDMQTRIYYYTKDYKIIAEIHCELGAKSGFMCHFNKVEVDPIEKAEIEDYINSVSEINTAEKLNDKIDFWISHLNELKVLNYKQSELVKSRTCYIKEEYYEDEYCKGEYDLCVEFYTGNTLIYMYTETSNESWSKTNSLRSLKLYKSGVIDNSKFFKQSKYYKFEVKNGYNYFDIEVHS